MGLFMPEDPHYNELERQTGFNRYKQLLSRHFGDWFKLNAITLLGALPLAAGIVFSIAASSILVLIPCSAVGGMIFGPFLSGLYDSLLRAFRDEYKPWKQSYKKSWRQNALGSLLPGALLGLMTGFFCFMAMLLWWSQLRPGAGTLLLYLFSAVLMFVLVSLYWPQLVLFTQKPGIRLRNCLLLCIKHFGAVMGIGLLQLLYWGLMVLLAPWSLLLLPVTGIWYIAFLSQLLIYDRLDEAFGIEEKFSGEQL